MASEAKSGKLLGVEPGSKLDFDLYDPSHKLEDLFGNLGGAALLERMLLWYQEDEIETLPWFSSADGARLRSILRSPFSRELQESTIARYQSRICEEGLSQVVSGPSQEGFAWSLF